MQCHNKFLSLPTSQFLDIISLPPHIFIGILMSPLIDIGLSLISRYLFITRFGRETLDPFLSVLAQLCLHFTTTNFLSKSCSWHRTPHIQPSNSRIHLNSFPLQPFIIRILMWSWSFFKTSALAEVSSLSSLPSFSKLSSNCHLPPNCHAS